MENWDEFGRNLGRLMKELKRKEFGEFG